MVALTAILSGPAGGDQARHADPLPDEPAGLLIGDVRVGEHVEDLVEQPGTIGLGLGAVDELLRKLVPGTGIRAGQCLVEQLHQLVEHLDVGFGQRCQQDRVTPVDRGALQRLIGCAAADLGEHAPPPDRQSGQVEVIGSVSSQEFQLVELGLEQLGRGDGGPAAQPSQAGHAQVGVDVEQAVQLHRPRRLQQRPEPVVGLGSGCVAGRGDPTSQAVDGRADDPFGAQPVTGQLQQNAGGIVFERPRQQELVEQLALTGGAQTPTQPSQHPGPVFPAGSSLPATVFRQQCRRDTRRNGQRVSEPIECSGRATGQVVGNPAQPRQRRQLDGNAEMVVLAVELPVCPIHELLVKGDDLIAGTHGRSIWILDDLTPLRQLAAGEAGDGTYLFTPRETVRILPGIDWSEGQELGSVNYLGGRGGGLPFTTTPDGETVRTYLDAGENPPRGAIITYRLAAAPEEPIKLTFRSANGEEIRCLHQPESDDRHRQGTPRSGQAAGTASSGTCHAPVAKIEGDDPRGEGTDPGPIVAPGSYTVTLKAGDTELTQPLTVVKPASVQASQADLDAQYDLLLRIHRQLDRTTKAINRMRDLREQLDGWAKRAEDRRGKELPSRRRAARKGARDREDTARARPARRLGGPHQPRHASAGQARRASGGAALGDYRPTDVVADVFAELTARIDAEIAKFEALVEDELPGINELIATAGFGAVSTPPAA